VPKKKLSCLSVRNSCYRKGGEGRGGESPEHLSQEKGTKSCVWEGLTKKRQRHCGTEQEERHRAKRGGRGRGRIVAGRKISLHGGVRVLETRGKVYTAQNAVRKRSLVGGGEAVPSLLSGRVPAYGSRLCRQGNKRRPSSIAWKKDALTHFLRGGGGKKFRQIRFFFAGDGPYLLRESAANKRLRCRRFKRWQCRAFRNKYRVFIS